MFKGQFSLRTIIIASLLIAITAISATASWTDYLNPFSFFKTTHITEGEAIKLETRLQSEYPSMTPLSEKMGRSETPVDELINSTTYPFTTASGATLEDMSSGTTALVGSSSDDGTSGLRSIGFPFFFNGIGYSQFDASANGYIRLGTTVNTPGGAVDFTNNLGSTNQTPVIAPYWDDLATGTTGNAVYKVVGTAPNRKMVVQWFVTVPRNTSGVPNATFQLWLYETTGQIEFVYGTGMVANTTNSGASIGMATAAATLASVTLNATSTSSTCSYSTANNANTIAITSGTKFSFTPTTVPTAAPTAPVFSNVGSTFLTLTWTDNASNELGFPVFFSTDNVNFSLLGTVGAAAGTGTSTGAAISGLLPSTTYYFKVYAVGEAILSSSLDTVGQATNPPVGNLTALDATTSENFNGLASSGTTFTWTDNVTVPSTYASDTTYTVGTGSSTTGALYSFGVAGTNPITDRALGTLASGGTTRYTAVRLVNSTGSAIGTLDVSYVGEQWRANNTSAQTLSFQYQVANAGTITDANVPTTGWTGESTLNFTSPILTTAGAIDGNAPANRSTKSSTITFGTPVAVGQEIWIRWVDADDTGNDHGFGVDDLSVTPHAVPAGPGTVQFSATSYSDLEGNTATITVNRTGGSSGAISVDYSTVGGSATPGTCGTDDYVGTTGTLNWADTDTAAKTFTVQLCVDTVVETEFVNLVLSNPVGTSITGTNPAPLNITDNPPGTIQFSSATYAGDEGSTVVVTATRTGGTGGAVSVDYTTGGGTATPGTCGTDDYVSASGTLNWANGDSASKTFNVTTCTDANTSEGNETVGLTLSNILGGATLGTSSATLTIGDVGASFCNSSPVLITDSTTNSSTIAVSGLVGTVNTVKVKLNGIQHSWSSDAEILLVGPNGEKFVILSDVGDQSGFDTSANLTLADSGAALMVNTNTAIPTGTYKPTSYGATVPFPAPAPAGPYQQAATTGSATFASVFSGVNPNGNWILYTHDDASGDTGTIANGWCLEISTFPPSPGTVQFNPAAYTPSEGVIQTVTVTRTSGTAGAVSVDYATGGGTATPGTCGTDDYVAASGTLSWADGDGAAKTFNVTTCSDAINDPGETIDITLSNATGGVAIGGTNPGTITITDIPPPLNGDYQVPGDYATLTAAVADYNLRGVSGPVRFLLNNVTYDTGSGETFPLVISTTGPDTTATNTLTIQPNTGITSTIVGSSASGIVVIGDQFVTINGDNVGGDIARNLTVNNTATTANSYVIGLFNFGGTKVARNATVRYSNIRGGVTAVGTVSWGIILNGTGGDYDNVLIENNKIFQAYVGIGHYGVAATGINNNNIIRNNIIGDTTGLNESIKLRGVEVTQSSGLTIDSNDIFGLPAGNSNATQVGVLLSTGGSNNTVTRNNIHDFYYTGTGGLSTHGILISENGGTTNITNNFVHNIKADGDVFNTATNILWMPAGITISGTTTGTLNIDHNSIYMSGATLGTSFTGNSACFSSVAGVTGVNFRNNALRNSMTTVGAPASTNKTYAIATIGAGSLGTMFSSINYNTYFVNGSNPNIGTFGQTDRLNLVAFQAATTQDANSIDQDPQFLSSTDLHLNVSSPAIGAGGIVGTTHDFDNDPRPAIGPDIGADELVQAVSGSFPAGSFYNASLVVGNTLAGDVSITNRLFLLGEVNAGSNTVSLGCNATVAGAGPATFINGAVRKDFCATGAFDFPVGDGGFSPVTVNVTALGTNPSSLTVRPFDQFLAGFDQTETISRNWSIEETGDVTADLLFTYLDGDVNGNEADYRVWRRESSGTDTNMCAMAPCVDTVLNTLGPITGVTTFSRWTGSKPLAPTSSAASISGRVTTASGQGIRGAAIVITGNNLPTPKIVKTGSLGYFQVDNLDTGQTYVVTVVSKRFTFQQPSRVMILTDSISDADFVANPLE